MWTSDDDPVDECTAKYREVHKRMLHNRMRNNLNAFSCENTFLELKINRFRNEFLESVSVRFLNESIESQ